MGRCYDPTRFDVNPAAGNAGDLVARVVLEQVTKQIGESFVIENRVGGGGVVASASVAHAEPDGYTVLLLSSSEGSSVVMHNTLTYDPVRDVIPVVMFGLQPNVLVVAPSRGWHTVKDMVTEAKAAPGKLNFASAGIGSASHWAAARLNLATGIQTQHIPFRGAEGLNELIAGRIDYYFVPLAPAVVNIKSGRVLPLAVSTPNRSPALPNVPTVADAGYPDAQYLFWGGLPQHLTDEASGPNRFIVTRGSYALLSMRFPQFQTFAVLKELYSVLATGHQIRVDVARSFLETEGLLEPISVPVIRPHTPEWFKALEIWDPPQSMMTKAAIASVGGNEAVCSVCGDDPTNDYQLPVSLRPPGNAGTLRLCDDCLRIKQQMGDRFERLKDV